MNEITIEQARRIAVRAQLLDGSATGVLDTVRRLGYLQLDPTNRIARSHLLVLWSRLGPFDIGELDRLLWQDKALFEWRAFVYPIEHLPLLRSRMRRYAQGSDGWQTRIRNWLEVNAPFRRHVLDELRDHGPLPGRAIEDRAVEPWKSSGWTGNRSVSQMLEFLWARGEVAVVGRAAGQRLWDLAERWYPETPAVPDDEAERELAAIRLRSLGIARNGPGTEARIAGVSGNWVVDAAALEAAEAPLREPGRTTLLSPFDRLIHDRDRAEDLFGFRYRIEIYVPKAKREYGYFVLPVLRGDRLIGRIDPEHDRRAHVLRVNAVHVEPAARREDLDGLDAALASLAEFIGAASVRRPD